MDTVWTTVKVRRSVLSDAADVLPGVSNAQIVQRALEELVATPALRASARQVPAGPQPSPPSDVSSSASQGREGEAGVNGDGGAAPDWDDDQAHLDAQAAYRAAREEPWHELQRSTPPVMPDQITVEEALTRCPVCNDALDDDRRCVDPDCASHRAPA